ncbi:biotin--[acetyl-CoA-carboxylase] ligase [Prosthecodimorpha staleyi]|uniref:biotin--[biotin carboxyl-carrier protein] ligase n=1 Tax=Prosthecodimorpha staleyi TaxID=2840188 RepID=A0A947GAP6_9HYPH|nr:biotin--[acetyl-CoA-carboxylase] ligase [Prosthecodimorpha staleyi]MBT9287852.1 biotin--[acetyl-CoA-carboxylase] ligase [Prosthecodimorpha staleyi]
MDRPTLGPKARAAGIRLECFETIGSTNTAAMERARAGDPGGVWFYAETQTAGRGRRGRTWATPTGNMAASFLRIVHVAPQAAATYGFVAGLALHRALSGLLAADRLALKWPNDLLLDGAKLSGILLEAERCGDGRMALVIGIGVNVVTAPEGMPYAVASLAGAGLPVPAAQVFERLAEAWVEIEALWDEGRGLAEVLSAWRACAAGLGAPVSVTLGSRTLAGRFEGIDAEGRLVLAAPDGGRHTITAGEVHFGPSASAAP